MITTTKYLKRYSDVSTRLLDLLHLTPYFQIHNRFFNGLEAQVSQSAQSVMQNIGTRTLFFPPWDYTRYIHSIAVDQSIQFNHYNLFNILRAQNGTSESSLAQQGWKNPTPESTRWHWRGPGELHQSKYCILETALAKITFQQRPLECMQFCWIDSRQVKLRNGRSPENQFFQTLKLLKLGLQEEIQNSKFNHASLIMS